MKYLAYFLFFGLLIGCSEKVEKPDYLLSEQRFVEMLTDFQIAEGIVRLGFNRTRDSIIFQDSIYGSVFRKHEISRAIFDSNYTYFSDRPKEFEKLYELVINNLSQRSAELEKPEEAPIDSIPEENTI